jgi:riboflavin kinase/FMN adenylyltransferase
MDMSLQLVEWDSLISTAYVPVPSAMTIGVFDGVHLGHAALIGSIVSRGPNPTVVTFRENPKKILSPRSYKGDIFSLEQKLAAFEGLGVVRVILIDFSEKFSKISGWEFIDLLEDRGRAVYLALGSSFRCGYRHKTGAEFIKRKNELKDIPTEIIQPVPGKTGPVSSSGIRSAIAAGDLPGAEALLGRKLELDLSGINGIPSVKEKKEGMVFDAAALHRITPADGTYPVFIYRVKPDGFYTEITVEKGKIFIPFRDDLNHAVPAPLEPGLRMVFNEFPI